MMARKQSAADRQRRLDAGTCPIHGIGLGQISGWFEELDWHKRQTLGRHYTLVDDGRKDCPLVIKAYGPEGPHEMLPEWEHILDGESDDDLAPQGELTTSNAHAVAGEFIQEIDSPKYPYRAPVLVQWSDADQAYVARNQDRPDLPIVRGKTMVEAVYEATILLYNLDVLKTFE